MRCPKCHYISFDDTERCRHCGFDLRLAPAEPDVDLPIRSDDEPEGAADDIELNAPPSDAPGQRRAVRRDAQPPAALDLPLFETPVPGIDDTPLIATPSAPRPPLAVRRPTPDTGRPRVAAVGRSSAAAALPFTAEAGGADGGIERGPGTRELDGEARTGRSEGEAVAPPAPRIAAALVDLMLMAAIDLTVVYFTLWLARLPLEDVGRLPLLPLITFFALLNGGYAVGFTTASGQSLGKLLFGVRVVTDAGGRVPLGQAIGRFAATVVSALTLGLGLLPVFSPPARRTLTDRLSHTRVVRA
jgi:uncharacterized RDD family membrane protein YckC